MAITEAQCPKCSAKVFASVAAPDEIKEMECPRCGEQVEIHADDRAIADLAEAAESDHRYTRNRFEHIYQAHSHDVEDVVELVKQKYQEELKIINTESDIPTLEHVREDIEEALTYITEDTGKTLNERRVKKTTKPSTAKPQP